MAEELCLVCNQTEQWHMEHKPKHAFSTTSTRFQPTRSTAARVAMPADAVVRMALIRKGILTPEDLTQVEQELSSAGVAFAAPDSTGLSEPVAPKSLDQSGSRPGNRKTGNPELTERVVRRNTAADSAASSTNPKSKRKPSK